MIVTDSVADNEITCDSQFMMDNINEIGFAICESSHWVPHDVPINMYMDNAGGHGAKKEKYVSILKRSHNIIVK